MTGCPRFNHLLVAPRLRVQNANAVSSPLTHGFPSMTAFLGLIWALERKARSNGIAMELNAVGVVCHGHQEQLTDDRFLKTFRLTRNPVDRNGSTAAIVEEGRIHLDLSLVIAVHIEPEHFDRRQQGLAELIELLAGMRVAGGTILPSRQPQPVRNRPWMADLTGDEEARGKAFREVCLRLLPGTALVSRDDLVERRLRELRVSQPDANPLDAWLSLARINWRYDETAGDGNGAWKHDRAGLGWVVPIPIGYGSLGALQAPGSVPNARDATTPFRFVESLYSMGEWLGPHRLGAPQDLLWYAESRPEEGLYRGRCDYHASA